ncbi:MAG TPA: hypothetical protein VK943_16295 [Arenibaculum sp.]|nr:hypothetical protein [Arenibaculum sp.]
MDDDREKATCVNCHMAEPAAKVVLRVDPTASEFFDGLVGMIPLCDDCLDRME